MIALRSNGFVDMLQREWLPADFCADSPERVRTLAQSDHTCLTAVALPQTGCGQIQQLCEHLSLHISWLAGKDVRLGRHGCLQKPDSHAGHLQAEVNRPLDISEITGLFYFLLLVVGEH